MNIPIIQGILSDDFLYFEGVKRPNNIEMIKDGEIELHDVDLLEKYFNDVYNLFLRKFASFAMFENISDEETIKMQALLQELIKVKGLIVNPKSIKDYDLL